MRLPVRCRLLALAWALVAVSAAPGLAVSHGFAHHEASHEHGDESPSASPKSSPALHEADAPDGHAHPIVSVAHAARLDLSAFDAIVAPGTQVSTGAVVGAPPMPIVAQLDHRPPSDLPRQPRAPPLG